MSKNNKNDSKTINTKLFNFLIILILISVIFMVLFLIKINAMQLIKEQTNVVNNANSKNEIKSNPIEITTHLKTNGINKRLHYIKASIAISVQDKNSFKTLEDSEIILQYIYKIL